MDNQQETAQKIAKESEVFVKSILDPNCSNALHHELYQHFSSELHKAVKGRICTPERMALLYPIFREINIEQDEIERYHRQEALKFARKEAKRRGAK